MKRLLLLPLLLLFSGNCQAACPSGANYVNPANPIGSLVTLSSIGVTTCYYIADSGSDSLNNGLSEAAPFLHSPGMKNCASNCASVTLAPGNGVIFRGGDTWHFGNSGATPYAGVVTGCAINGTQAAGLCIDAINGTATNPIYYGVDSTWFTGGSWTRPILTADNPLCNSTSGSPLSDGATCTVTTDSYGQPSYYVSACGYQVGSANNLVDIGFSKYIIFDDFVLTGLCQSHTGQPGGEDSHIYYGSAQAPIYLLRNYIHGDSHLHWAALNGSAGCTGSTVCINLNAFYGSVNNGSVGETVAFSIVDFSDSDPGGSNLCQCGFYNVAYNEFNYTAQGIPGDLHTFHDNIYENFFEDGHSNVIEDAETSPIGVIYNNIFRHIEHYVTSGGGVLLWPGPTGSSDHSYVFNNIAYDVGALEYFNAGGVGITTNNGSYVVFNNTWQTNVNQPILRCENVTGSTLDTNNHYIDDGAYLNSGCTPTVLTHLAMTNSTATSDGYASSQTFAYSPTTSGSPTVGAGTNEYSGYCSTLLASGDALIQAAGTACRLATTYSCAYNSTSHTVSCPANTAIARPVSGAWDAGAYEYSNSGQVATPTFSPVSGTYSSTQSVSLSTTTGGATLCYTQDGTTPTANGAGTCTHGTTYSTPVSVSVNLTLKAIASESGYTDSTVASAAYIISRPAPVTALFAKVNH